jgi:hypothetical protein
MTTLELVQNELHKANEHLAAAQEAAWKAGWTNDEGYALSILAHCGTAVDKSLQNRFKQGARNYEPEYEVTRLLDLSMELDFDRKE